MTDGQSMQPYVRWMCLAFGMEMVVAAERTEENASELP